ncbi:MAG: hypothetical protein K5929_01300 [Lachnospiraceae bacterium]|nr:hypothetical protein [Lachnospiraceae bacterium]
MIQLHFGRFRTYATYRVIEGGDTDGKIGCIEYVAPLKKKKSYKKIFGKYGTVKKK